LFSRVVDDHQINRHFSKKEVAAYIALDDDTPDDAEPVNPDEIHDEVLAQIVRTDSTQSIIRCHEHCTLLQNQPNEELTDAEKVAAWTEFKLLDRPDCKVSAFVL
jgi:transcriptional regulator ATRX